MPPLTSVRFASCYCVCVCVSEGGRVSKRGGERFTSIQRYLGLWVASSRLWTD